MWEVMFMWHGRRRAMGCISGSPDNGTTWVPPITSPGLKLSTATGVTQYPQMSANGSNVYVIWSQTSASNKVLQLWFAYSANNGHSFTTENITDISSSNQAITPAIASWGSAVVVGWTNG